MKCLNLMLLLSIFLMCGISFAQNSHKDFLDPHNIARAEVGVKPLTWNDTLESFAQKYADSKIKTCEMESSNGPYGENLAEGLGEVTVTEAVKLWLDEKPNYNYEQNKCINNQECMHYTQVIWNTTRQLGCARSKCDNGGTFIICSYDPPGNIIGEKPY